MVDRIEKLEQEITTCKQKFELLEQFFKSDAEKTQSLIALSDALKEFVIETDKKFKDLEDAYITQCKNRELLTELIESQGRTIDTIIQTLDSMNEK